MRSFHALYERVLAEAVGKEPVRVVFVCMGNTDRSPMAETIARKMLAGRAVVTSAGCKKGGRPSSDNAQMMMKKIGLDCSGHVSRQLDAQIVAENDLVVFLDRWVADQYRMFVPKGKLVVCAVGNPAKNDPKQFMDAAITIGVKLRKTVVPLVQRLYDYKNKPVSPIRKSG